MRTNLQVVLGSPLRPQIEIRSMLTANEGEPPTENPSLIMENYTV